MFRKLGGQAHCMANVTLASSGSGKVLFWYKAAANVIIPLPTIRMVVRWVEGGQMRTTFSDDTESARTVHTAVSGYMKRDKHKLRNTEA